MPHCDMHLFLLPHVCPIRNSWACSIACSKLDPGVCDAVSYRDGICDMGATIDDPILVPSEKDAIEVLHRNNMMEHCNEKHIVTFLPSTRANFSSFFLSNLGANLGTNMT